ISRRAHCHPAQSFGLPLALGITDAPCFLEGVFPQLSGVGVPLLADRDDSQAAQRKPEIIAVAELFENSARFFVACLCGGPLAVRLVKVAQINERLSVRSLVLDVFERRRAA